MLCPHFIKSLNLGGEISSSPHLGRSCKSLAMCCGKPHSWDSEIGLWIHNGHSDVAWRFQNWIM